MIFSFIVKNILDISLSSTDEGSNTVETVPDTEHIAEDTEITSAGTAVPEQRKKHSPVPLLRVVLIVVGLTLLCYPLIANFVNDLSSSKHVSSYQQTIENLAQYDKERILAEAREYNADLAARKDQFYEAPGDHDLYERLLNPLGDGTMGMVTIPKLGVCLPIYHDTDEAILQVAAGHMYHTSLPVGGGSTHCVIAGHTGMPSANLFTHLDALEEGDVFYLDVMGERHAYKVDQIKTVLPDEYQDIMIIPDKDYCTLSTCTPYGVNSHRLLVRAERTNDDTSISDASGANLHIPEHSLWARLAHLNAAEKALIAGIAAIIAAIIVRVLLNRRRKKMDAA